MNIKKLVYYSAFFSIMFLLQACSSGLTGHYIYGHEVNSFQPCDREETLWVRGSNEQLELMKKEYLNYASKPYEEVFIEITGDYLDKSSDGFAMDYDGQIQVERLITIRKKSDSDCTL
jgi:NlpE C-terminal OB domain